LEGGGGKKGESQPIFSRGKRGGKGGEKGPEEKEVGGRQPLDHLFTGGSFGERKKKTKKRSFLSTGVINVEKEKKKEFLQKRKQKRKRKRGTAKS